MLALDTAHGVTRVHLWTRTSRLLGYSVSAWATRGVLVDTGFPHAAAHVRDVARRLGIEAAAVTHAHEDHGGNARLLAELGLPVVATAGTLDRLRRPAALPYYRRIVWGTPRPLGATQGTVDDAPLRAAGLQLLAAPGHLPDHAVVWDAERGHLFGGDLWLGVRVRVAHAGEAPRALVGTLRRLADLDPAVLFDAHRGVVERPAALLRAKADWLEATVHEVERLAEAGYDPSAIRARVLGREPWVAFGSLGEYGKMNLVRAALEERR